MAKRIISLFLAIIVLILNGEIFVTAYAENAEDDLELKSITVIYNKSTKKINVLEDKEHNYYMNTSDISAFSHFNYSSEKSTFYYDVQDPNSFCPKEVLVHKEAKSIWVKNHWLYCKSIKTERPFTHIIEQNGVTFLPIDVIFPCLDTSIDVVEGKLIIEPAESTVAESLCNIDVDLGTNDLEKYSCNLCDFTENKKIVYLSTLYEDLTNVRVSRLPVLKKMIPNVKIDHFENAFTSYLLDDSAYLEAVESSESAIKQISRNTIDIYEILQDNIDGAKVVYKELPKEVAKRIVEAKRKDIDWLKDTTLDDGFEKIGDKLDIASFGIDAASASIATYNAHEYAVADNISMLSAVYDLENKTYKYDIFMKEEDIEALAAQSCYKLASEELLTAISDSIKKEIVKYGVGQLTDMALKEILNKSWIDGERLLLSKIFPEFTTTTSIMEKLPYHYLISNTALQEFKYRRYNAYQERNVAEHYGHESRTEEHITKARQSLILYLTASKHCYKSIKEVYEANHQKFALCDRKIAEIDDLLIKLYLAGFSVRYDSLESLKKEVDENSKKLDNLKTAEPVDWLNLSAMVFAKDYQIPDAGPFLALYESPSGDSKQIVNIPKGSEVTIISVPDNYQDGDWNHQMVKVDFNGQEGYVHTNYLFCNPLFDMSIYTKEQVLDIGKLLFQEYDNLANMFAFSAGFIDVQSTNESFDWYEKLQPAGLTIQRLKDDFYKYFSKDTVGFFRGASFEDLYTEKDGYLWRLAAWGDEIWRDHFEVKSVESISDNEVIFNVEEILIPDFYEHYNTETFSYKFRLVNEDGKWMLTVPEDRYKVYDPNSNTQTGQTYEDIYGSLVFDGVNNQKGLYGHEDYVDQPTGYRIQKYFLGDINNDGIKELILEVTLSGTDETFRECYTYEKGGVKWLGTYDDIYVAEDCYIPSDGNGLVVVSLADDEMEMFKGYSYRYWRPWDIVQKGNRIPYVSDFPKIGYYLTDYDNPTTIPDNIRSKLGIKLSAYSPANRSPLKESFNASLEQLASNNTVSDKYTAVQGIVNTEKSDLMLRRLPNTYDKTNIIAQIPKGTKITLLLPFKSYFAQDDGDQTYWYYADYNGKTGFVSAKYIKETTDRVGMTDEQITSVAKLLYLSAMNAESWSYSNCFDYSMENDIGCPDSYPHSNEFRYYPISGIKTTADWYAQIHKQFSDVYDGSRAFNYGGLEALIRSNDSYPPYYWNNNGQWYLLDAIFRKGDIPLDIAYSEPFKVVHLTKQKESGNEVFFNGYLDYSQGDSAWVYDGSIDKIDNFSICFEDGRWKVGLF